MSKKELNPDKRKDRITAKNRCRSLNIELHVNENDKNIYNLLVSCMKAMREAGVDEHHSDIRESFLRQTRNKSWFEIVHLAKDWFVVFFDSDEDNFSLVGTEESEDKIGARYDNV